METELPLLVLHPPRIFTSDKWHQCYCDWLMQLYRSRRKLAGARDYIPIVRRFFKIASKNPEDITRHDVERFVSLKKRNGNEPRPDTCNKRLKALRSFYRYAQNYGVERGKEPKIKTVPLFSGINPTVGIGWSEPDTNRRGFDEDEANRFLSVIGNDKQGKRDYAFFLFCLLTGRRQSEVRLLKWGDIRHVTWADGKPGMAYTWMGKNKTRKERLVELPPRVWEAIQDYLSAWGRLTSMQPHHAVFVSTKSQWSNRPMCATSAWKYFHKYMHLSGLANETERGELVIHSFRIRRAADMLEATGGDLKKTMEDLDHKTMQMTLRYLEKAEKRKAKRDEYTDAIAAKYGVGKR